MRQESKMIIINKEAVTPEQLIHITKDIEDECMRNQVIVKTKHDLAQSLCEIKTIEELDEVVSDFICNIVPVFRNNIRSWCMNRENIMKILK